MRRLILIFAIWTLTQAKPEMYREKEDFSYSRSSSDEGHKSGFYGAQRGNMGGNFEKSHNMDRLAQHQMSGLVRQVEGELGDTSKAREGQVFTSANSRGLYGTGAYDLSNLGGRNFGEGTTYHDSQAYQSHSGYTGQSSHSAQSVSHSLQHSDGRSQSSGYSGYQYRGQAGQSLHTDDQQAIDLSSGRYGYGSAAGSSRYSQFGNSGQSQYRDISEAQQSSDSRFRGSSDSQVTGSDYMSRDQVRSRLIGGRQSPTIIIRPGTRVSVPVAVQSYDQRSDAESVGNSEHRSDYASSGNPKYYESSQSYRKEWEKHDSRPVAVPLAIPSLPTRSELYDDAQIAQISGKQYDASGTDSESSHGFSRHNAHSQITSSSQSRHQSDYSSQGQGSTSLHSDGTSASVGSSGNLVGEVDTRPKSYQSSYSYHKAWERQGDPYVIIPSTKGTDDSSSQRLTTYDQSYGGQSRHSSTGYAHGCSIQCDESSHLRVSRSVDYNTGDEPYQSQTFDIGQEEMGQQVQTGWGNVEDLGQQSQSDWDQIQDFGQQSQTFPYGQQPQTDEDLTNFEQQSQANIDNLEDFGQQVQSSWEPNQKNKDLSQHPQKQIEINEQQTGQKEHLQFSDKNYKSDFDQQIVDNPEGNVQWQQTQDEWHDMQHAGQQTQNSWDQSVDMEQQTQQTWDKIVPPQAVDLKDYSQHKQPTTLHEAQNTITPIKPVWELSQDSVNTSKNNSEPKISSDGKIYHWLNVHGHNYQHTEDSSHTNFSSHSTSSSSQQNTQWKEVSQTRETHNQSHSHALQDLWGMIENFEKESSKPKHDTSIQAETQNSDFDWSQMEAHEFTNTQSQIPNQSEYHFHIPVGEIKKDNNKTDYSKIIPVQESGRGDISDLDETSLSVTTLKTTPIQPHIYPQVHVSKLERGYKSPEEIDSLSLKKNITSNLDIGHQKSDTTLSVLSIQDWLNQEKQHGDDSQVQYKPVQPIINVKPIDKSPRQKTNTQESQEKLFEQALEEIQQSELSFEQGQKTENLDQQVQSTWTSPEDLENPKQTKSEQIENLEEMPDSVHDFGQQVQSTWGKPEYLEQKTDDVSQQVHSNLEKLDDLGQKPQTAWGSTEDFGQQVQSNWRNSDDFGQQIQTSWQPSDSRSLNPSGAENFYELNHPKNYITPTVNENIENQRVQDSQIPHNLVTTVPTTTEAITEKPGFWRGVGDKFSNAKEKVFSWFRRS